LDKIWGPVLFVPRPVITSSVTVSAELLRPISYAICYIRRCSWWGEFRIIWALTPWLTQSTLATVHNTWLYLYIYEAVAPHR
jgi:hypothetical protein